MDADWLGSIFGNIDMNNDLFGDLIDGIDESEKKKYMTGLGDFHLRSAIKCVNIDRIRVKRGRYRVNQDYINFISIFPSVTVTAGIPADILVYFLRTNESIVLNSPGGEYVKKRSAERKLTIDMVCRRITMEMRRDSTHQGETGPCNSLRKKLLQEYTTLPDSTGYSYLRTLFEMFVLCSSSIASKRLPPEDAHSLGVLKVNEEGIPIYLMIMLGDLLMVIGGDLLFVTRVDPDYKVERKLVSVTSPFVEEKLISLCGDNMKHLDNSIFASRLVKGEWTCYSCDVLRMISDKMAERDIVLRNARIGNLIIDSVYPSERTINDVFEIGDILMLHLGNDAYKVIKCYEALITGILLSRCESIILDKEEFLRETISDLLDDNPEYEWSISGWLSIANRMATDHHLSQLYGLYRLWGHPVVKSTDGLQKVNRIGKANKTINKLIANMAGISFKEQLYSGYKKKWGRYPAFKLLLDNRTVEELYEESYLIKCLVDNRSFDTRKDVYIPSDWDLVISQKTLSLPETFNLTMVVDDKAISPTKDYLISVALGQNRLMNPFERRGVLKWMNEDYHDCQAFLQKINDNSLDSNDCVIGLYPKERELNSIPRMFALMSAKMRNYVVVTEHMIADDILPFFPQITMMDDLLSLTKKIHGATRCQQNKVNASGLFSKNKYLFQVDICLNMDFEKWNLNMRKESTYSVFLEMGRLYGMDELFNRTYDIFHESFVYVSDENAKLEIGLDDNGVPHLRPDNVHSYTGHIGGFEGLRQKGWTVFTVAVIQMDLKDFPVAYKLMGQGDNQVLMLTLKTNSVDQCGNITDDGILELRGLLKLVINRLESVFLELGLPLKTLESWRSEEFFLYGKFPVKKGIPLSMSLKKLSRSFPFSNDDSMTIDNVMGSVFTNAQSASMSDVTHLLAYYSGIFEVINGAMLVLNWHPLIGQGFFGYLKEGFNWFTYENVSSDDNKRSKKISISIQGTMEYYLFIELLSLMPKSLGGSNGITEYEFLMRGFPDNQSRDLTYLCEIISSNVESDNPKERQVISGLINFVRFNLSNSSNLDFLVEDPCALNLLQPKTPMTILRKKVKDTLTKTANFKNENFMGLFKLSIDESRRSLLNKLAEGDVLFPRVLHDCYAASLFGFVDGIVSKVDKTVTVQRICLETSDDDIIKGLCLAEKNYIKYLFWRCEFYRAAKYENEPKISCPTNYIRWLRNAGWKKEVQGVTVPYPSHTLMYRGNDCCISCDGNDIITCHVSDFLPETTERLVSSLGQSPPYLGSYTKEKVKTYDRVALYSSEPLLRRIVRMLRIIGWGNLEESNLHNYLRNLLRSVCDVDDSIFLLNKEDIGGSLEHRYRDSALKHGALASNMYGLGTWIHMSTDKFGQYTKGSKNVTLHFQAILCWVQSRMYEILLDSSFSNGIEFKEFHFHLSCSECIKSVEYDVPDISSVPKALIPKLKDNPYCYVKNVMLTEKDRSVYAIKDIFQIDSNIGIHNLDSKSIKYLFHEFWAASISRDIFSTSETDNTSIGTGVLEINKYPRIAFYRIGAELLYDLISDISILSVMRMEAEKDTYKESAISLDHCVRVLLNTLNECDNEGFIGLSILFSWENQIKEIMNFTSVLLPGSVSMSVGDCLLAAKRSLINYVENKTNWFNHRCRYINLNEMTPVDTSILLRYAAEFDFESVESCSECRRSILLNISNEKLLSLSGTEKCEYGHIWFHKEYTTKYVTVICIPEDALSKQQSFSYLIKTKVVKQSIRNKELRNHCNTMRRCFSLKPVFSSNDIRYTNDPSIIEGKILFQGNVDPMRLCYRCIPTELSSGYRLLDILVGLRIPVMERSCRVLNLGDGFGGTGYLLEKLIRCHVINATLVDCTSAFPQTFPNSRPSSQYLSSNLSRFDNSLSKIMVNNIFSEAVVLRYRQVCELSGTKLGICDIELEHNETSSFNNVGRFPYSRLIKQLRKINLDIFLVKIRVKSNVELYHVLEIANYNYHHFEVYITPTCNNMKGEFFLRLEGAKEELPIESRIMNFSTRNKILRRFINYTGGKSFSNVDSEYYFAQNLIMIDPTLQHRMLSYVKDWIKEPRLNIDMSMKSFTSLFLSIAAARNPRLFVHHTDKKDKYEYNDDLLSIGWRIFTLGLAKIQSESTCCSALDNIESYLLIRPAVVSTVNKVKVIRKYTYMIVSETEYEDCKSRNNRLFDYTTLPPLRLMRNESIQRMFPIIRLINMRDHMLQQIDRLDLIEFSYLSRKRRAERALGAQRSVVLEISKTSWLSLIEK
nr:polymerase [Cytorhabdovirus sp. 'lycii']